MTERNFQELMPEHATKRRCPVALLVDVSSSMEGEPIEEVKRGLEQFVNDILNDSQASKSVDLCVITFGGTVEVVQEFAPIDRIDVSNLTSKLVTKYNTPMGNALLASFRELESWKRNLRSQGILYFMPWNVLFTDGLPTDMKRGDSTYEEIKQQLRSWQQSRKFIPWAFGTKTADFDLLKDLYPEGHVYRLAEAKFSAVFKWLSASITKISRSKPGTGLALDKPSAPQAGSLTQQIIFEV